MQIRLRTLVLALVTVAGVGCGGIRSPEALAEKLAAALTHSDVDSAYALLSSSNPQADLQFNIIYLVTDCSYGNECSISPGPLTETAKKQMTDEREKYGRTLDGVPEGLITIHDKMKTKDSSSEMKFSLAYAKIDGQYRILTGAYTPEKLQELRAKSPQAIADEMLSVKIDNDPAWKNNANKLPADGGEPGKALADYVAAASRAFKAKDFASLIALDGERGKFLYREKETDGTPVPEKKRELTLRLQSVQALTDVRVLGGYVQGNTAAVVFEGHDGTGWLLRGAYLMKLENGKWETQMPLAEHLPPT
jgi:hypothetical protein